MRAEVFGDGGEDVVFVLGWSNRPTYQNVRWLVDRVVEAGFRVHAVELPRVISDFDAQSWRPSGTTPRTSRATASSPTAPAGSSGPSSTARRRAST